MHGQIAYGWGRMFLIMSFCCVASQSFCFEELLDDITKGGPMCGRLTLGACLGWTIVFQTISAHVQICSCLTESRLTSDCARVHPTSTRHSCHSLQEVRDGEMSQPSPGAPNTGPPRWLRNPATVCPVCVSLGIDSSQLLLLFPLTRRVKGLAPFASQPCGPNHRRATPSYN